MRSKISTSILGSCILLRPLRAVTRNTRPRSVTVPGQGLPFPVSAPLRHGALLLNPAALPRKSCLFLWAGWDKHCCFLPGRLSAQTAVWCCVWGVNRGAYTWEEAPSFFLVLFLTSPSSLLHHTPHSLPAFPFAFKDEQIAVLIFPEQARLAGLWRTA